MHQLVFIAINLVMKEKIGEKMLKHYVEFTFINPLRYERMEVKERNEKLIDFPEGIAAYQFYDRNEVVADDGEILLGEKKNFSGKKYLIKHSTVAVTSHGKRIAAGYSAEVAEVARGLF